MINVSELMSDSDFCDHYTIIREPSEWVNGRFEPVSKILIERYRPVQPAEPYELELVPEGDRHKAVVKFFALPDEPFYITEQLGDSDDGFIADEILYRDHRYKIVKIMPWNAHGYIRALGVMLEV